MVRVVVVDRPRRKPLSEDRSINTMTVTTSVCVLGCVLGVCSYAWLLVSRAKVWMTASALSVWLTMCRERKFTWYSKKATRR